MYVSFALFADAANLSQEGKLNILGVFDALHVAGVPAVHPRATLVVRLKADADDAGMHQITLAWTGPDGEELWSSQGGIEVPPPPPGTIDVDLPLIATLDLPIREAGQHVMRVLLGEELAAELFLHVRVGSGVLGGPAVPAGALLS